MKKRYIISCLVLLAFTLNVNAQYNITPGKGFDKIYIGMNTKNLSKILGQPESKISIKKEKKEYVNSGYDPDKEFEFTLPCKSVYEYNDNAYVIWKVYSYKGKVTYINISSYQVDSSVAATITVNDKLHFYDNAEKVKHVMGDPDKIVVKKEYNFYFYLEKGIIINMDNDEARNFYIFSPIDKEKAQELIKYVE